MLKTIQYNYLNYFRYNVGNPLRKGLTQAEEVALEAIHRAVEFNPHVPKVKYVLYLNKFLIFFFFKFV